MDMRLNGHSALVTGGSGGIGAAIARGLADEGCDVLVHGRRAEPAERTAELIAGSGVRTATVLGDVAEPGAVDDIAAAAMDFGVDILVNNAGPLHENDWDSADAQDWDRAWQGNVVSAAMLTRALLPGLRAAGWGRVIMIGSRLVTVPIPSLVEYSAVKAAVVNATTNLAKHLAGTGITANCVSPGVVLTDTARALFERRAEAEGWAGDWDEIERRVTVDYAPNPVGRLGRAEDIAGAVTYLASPVADYVNGIELRVDGGINGTS